MKTILDKVISKDIKANKAYEIEIKKPTLCPHCNIAVDASKEATTNIFNTETDKIFSVIFKCPLCDRYFSLPYRIIKNTSYPVLSEIIQYPPILNNFDDGIPDNVAEFSPRFKETYDQSLFAYNVGLGEIAGLGFRKSIEILIKDYLISIKNENSEEIKKIFLASCIKKIDNIRIKKLATAITWLGNDEAHYDKIHKDKDIKDMLAFISSLIIFISSELVFLKAENFLNKK